MVVSYKWLQEYFNEALPEPENLAELLTMRAFEVESVDQTENGDTVLDIDVLPNRAHDCLSHEGIAREISVLTGMAISERKGGEYPNDGNVAVEINDTQNCRRYIGVSLQGVRVADSPEWLKERLSAIGQRPISNVVDATNFIMFDTGQPLHAFDADKVAGRISVRMAREGERITTLDGKDVELDTETLVIADEEGVLAIAGVKGGTKAEVDEKTTNLILEAANFHPTTTRKTARRLGIQTDSSKRFENEPTPERAGTAMERLVLLLSEIGGAPTVEGGTDVYPKKRAPYVLGLTLEDVEHTLGISIPKKEVVRILEALSCGVREVKDPRAEVARAAREYLGAPYTYGASISFDAPKTFDCSSFTAYLYAQAGIQIPRMAVDQFVFGEEIAEEELIPGDVVFSRNERPQDHTFTRVSDGISVTHMGAKEESEEFMKGAKVPGGVSHNGIYVGSGEVVHAHPEKGVLVEKLQDAEKFAHIVGYRRIPKSAAAHLVVTVPDVRLDLRIKEDLIEEIGRVYGYDNIPGTLLPKKDNAPVNKLFYVAHKIRRTLERAGFSEIYGYSFRDKGEVELLNPIAKGREFMRTNLSDGLAETLRFNERYADLLTLSQVRVFEIGNVFDKNGEYTHLAIGVKNKTGYKKEKARAVLEGAVSELSRTLRAEASGTYRELPDGGVVWELSLADILPGIADPDSYEELLRIPETDTRFNAISSYPFVTRDIALWVPEEVSEGMVREAVLEKAGELLVAHTLFDAFKKEKRVSYAYRLVFQSHEKTLTDAEVNEIMNGIAGHLEGKGWEVR